MIKNGDIKLKYLYTRPKPRSTFKTKVYNIVLNGSNIKLGSLTLYRYSSDEYYVLVTLNISSDTYSYSHLTKFKRIMDSLPEIINREVKW